MNLVALISEATVIVQLILLLLMFFSVFSWAIIIFKRRSLRAAASQSQKFLAAFRKSKNLAEVGDAARKAKASPLAALFQAGYKELAVAAAVVGGQDNKPVWAPMALSHGRLFIRGQKEMKCLLVRAAANPSPPAGR